MVTTTALHAPMRELAIKRPLIFEPELAHLMQEGSWFATTTRNVDLIELAIKIEIEGRPGTPEESAQLVKYVGFGASAIRNLLFPDP